jgi:hypothetical protein
LIGMLMFFRMSASEAHFIGQSSEKYRSIVMGIYFFGAQEGRGLLTPLLGRLIDPFGFHAGFTATAVFLLLAVCICAWWLRENP